MPTFNVREFKGIYSDIDTADKGLAFVKDANNVLFGNTYFATETLSIEEASEIFNLGDSGVIIEDFKVCWIPDDLVRNKTIAFDNKKVYVIVYRFSNMRYISYKEEGQTSEQIVSTLAGPQTESKIVQESTHVRIYTTHQSYMLRWVENQFDLSTLNDIEWDENAIQINEFVGTGVIIESRNVKLTEVEFGFIQPNITTTQHYMKGRMVVTETGEVLEPEVYFQAREIHGTYANSTFFIDRFWRNKDDVGSQAFVSIYTLGLVLPDGWNTLIGYALGNLFIPDPVFQWRFQDEAISETTGFEATRVDFLLTAILDEKAEIPISSKIVQKDSTVTDTYYGIKLTVTKPAHSRLTGLRLYAKEKLEVDTEKYEDLDYEEIKFIDLTKDSPELTNTVARYSFTGVFLSQQIGIFYDPDTYKIIKGEIDQYVKVDGFGYHLHKGNIFPSTLGAGQIQDQTPYLNEPLDLFQESKINFIANINNTLGVFTDQKLYFVGAETVGTAILYAIKDVTELGVRDYNDVIETPDGVLIHTRDGIFIANTNDRQSISEPIDDVVRANYETGAIAYSDINDQIYYFVGNTAGDVYIFNTVKKNWSKVQIADSTIIRVVGDGNAEVYAIGRNKVYTLTKKELVDEAYIDYGNIDLGDSKISKAIHYMWIDLECIEIEAGAFIKLKLNDNYEFLEYLTPDVRKIIKIPIPLGEARRSKQLLKLSIIINKANVVINNLDIYYNVTSVYTCLN